MLVEIYNTQLHLFGAPKRVSKCHDPVDGPAPFTYIVWQKGYFHPFPLTVGVFLTNYDVICRKAFNILHCMKMNKMREENSNGDYSQFQLK